MSRFSKSHGATNLTCQQIQWFSPPFLKLELDPPIPPTPIQLHTHSTPLVTCKEYSKTQSPFTKELELLHPQGTYGDTTLTIQEYNRRRPTGDYFQCFMSSIIALNECDARFVQYDFKQACCTGCRRRPSPTEAPQNVKIHPFSKMAVTFEPLMGF